MAAAPTIFRDASMTLNLGSTKTFGLLIRTATRPTSLPSARTRTRRIREVTGQSVSFTSSKMTGSAFNSEDETASPSFLWKVINSMPTLQARHHCQHHKWTNSSFKFLFFLMQGFHATCLKSTGKINMLKEQKVDLSKYHRYGRK